MEGFHLVSGDFAGYGDLAYYRNISDTDVCWRLCLNTPRCKSYEFSRTDNWCNLNSADTPNEPEFKDQAFCVKTGAVPRRYIYRTLSMECVDSYIWKSGNVRKTGFWNKCGCFFVAVMNVESK